MKRITRVLLMVLSLAISSVSTASTTATTSKEILLDTKEKSQLCSDIQTSAKMVELLGKGDDKLSIRDHMQVASLNCGIPPIPPVGCKVGACVCDQYGRNCSWTFVCN